VTYKVLSGTLSLYTVTLHVHQHHLYINVYVCRLHDKLYSVRYVYMDVAVCVLVPGGHVASLCKHD